MPQKTKIYEFEHLYEQNEFKHLSVVRYIFIGKFGKFSTVLGPLTMLKAL